MICDKSVEVEGGPDPAEHVDEQKGLGKGSQAVIFAVLH